MELYLKNLEELEQNFSTEEACRRYLFELRWPDGFVCPACHHEKSWVLSDGLLKCKSCGRKTSIIAGTIFERNPQAFGFMVPGGLVGDMSEERSQCVGIEAHPWAGKLPNRMDVVT